MKQTAQSLLIAGALCLAAVRAQAQTIHYVVPPGTAGVTPTPPFTAGWHEAATNIQHAVDAAASGARAIILITNGTYYSSGPAGNNAMINLGLKTKLTLRSVNGPAVTIIDGNFPLVTNRCLYGNLTGSNISNYLHGLTFRNGLTAATWAAANAYGGGIYLRADRGGISNCVFYNNVAYTNGAATQGGGLYARGQEYMVDCLVSNNQAGVYGGGYLLDIFTIRNCTFRDNKAAGAGGGINVGNARPTLLKDCTIRGNRSGTSPGGMNLGANITLTNCTIAGNTALLGAGGGIFAQAANVALLDCRILDNESFGSSTMGGGGLALRSTGGYATNCIISGNHRVGNGGGVYLQDGSWLDNCTLSNNTSTSAGGGVYAVANSRLLACDFIGNATDINGGGAYLTGANTLTRDCTFLANTAASSAGAIFCRLAGAYRVEDCRFIRNSAGQYGGAVFDDTRTAVVSNCIFIGNWVAGGTQPWGGAVRSAALVTHCIVTNNSAGQRGGGVCDGNLVRNCLIAFNTSLTGGGVQNVASVENCTIVTNTGHGTYGFLTGYALTNCLVYGNTLGDVACSAQSGVRTVRLANCLYGRLGTEPMDLVTSECLAGRDPRFVDLVGNDYQLAPGSPCINRGVNLAWMTADAKDLAGERRVRGSRVDIGAYEAPSVLGSILTVR